MRQGINRFNTLFPKNKTVFIFRRHPCVLLLRRYFWKIEIESMVKVFLAGFFDRQTPHMHFNGRVGGGAGGWRVAASSIYTEGTFNFLWARELLRKREALSWNLIILFKFPRPRVFWTPVLQSSARDTPRGSHVLQPKLKPPDHKVCEVAPSVHLPRRGPMRRSLPVCKLSQARLQHVTHWLQQLIYRIKLLYPLL